MRAIAYWHGPERIRKLAQVFAYGCNAHGIPCDVLKSTQDVGPADLVWVYGLGEGRIPYERHANAIRVVGDKGYFAGHDIEKHFRVSVNAQQPDRHLRLRKHPRDRFDALGIKTQPVAARGDYVLLCGIGPKQCGILGLEYGEWERAMYARLRQVTDRTIIVREKPKNPPIPGVPRSSHGTTAQAIRGAWTVVCLTGNVGVDAILHGVPVIAEAGPGSVYYNATIDELETVQPLASEDRLDALADVAYWQWRRDEIGRGDLFANLRREWIV